MELFLDLLRSVVYGVIEGITEWLPISSTGHMILAEQPLVGADDGVRVLLPAHAGPPALQVMRQRAAADLAELVLFFQPRNFDDRAFFCCRHNSSAPFLHRVHKRFFNAAEQHDAQNQRRGGKNQTVHDAKHRDRAGA